MRRLLLTSILVGAVLFGASALASAQQYPPSGPTITLSSQNVAGGGAVTVSGTGWQPGAQITITVQSPASVLGTVSPGASGTFSVTFQIPCSAGAGQHTITGSGTGQDGQQHSVSASLTVGACGVATRALATTGSSSLSIYVGIGVAFMLLGAALTVAFARRRKERLGI